MTDHIQPLHPAWPLLLQHHPQLAQKQQSACTLLSVSKAMAAYLQEVAAGQMHLVIDMSDGDEDAAPALLASLDARLQSCSRWLLKHGHLLQSLDLDVPGEALVKSGIASALRNATAATAAAAVFQGASGCAAPAAAASTQPHKPSHH
jgi:hypothetical protein